jgi:hypothetical protein
MAPNRQSGQLRIATGIDQRGGVPSVPSSGFGEAMRGLAADFGQVGAKIGALADHAAAVEGAEAGKIAGLDPEFRPTKNLTIRGEAFDRAGLQVYETRTRTAMLADLDAAFEQHQADPAALQQAFADKRRAWIGEALPEVRADLELSFDNAALTFSRQAQRAQVARIAAEQKGALTTELGEGLKRLSQQAYALGLDADADAVMAAGVSSLAKTLERTDTRGERLVSPAEAARLFASAKEEIATARINGAFSRLPSLRAKEEFLNKLETDFANSEGVAKEFDLRSFERVTAHLRSELVTARAEGRQRVADVRERVKELQAMTEKGFAPTEDQIAGLKARAEALGDPGVNEAVALFEDVRSVQVAARKMPPAAIAAEAEALRAQIREKGPSAASVARVEMLDKLAEEARQQLATDPLGWAARSEYTKVAPIDLDNFESSLKARLVQAEDVAQHYQLAEPRYLRPEEAKALAGIAAQGGDRMLAIAGDVTRVAGPRAPRILREIWQEAPLVATLGGHVADVGVSAVAQDVAAGVALRADVTREKGEFKSVAPSAEQARAWAREVHGGAYNGLGATEEALVSATNTAYEVRARRRGIAATEPNAELWRQTFREMIGERSVNGATYGGIALTRPGTLWGGSGAVVVPANVRQDGFLDLIAEIRPEDFGASPPRFADNSPVSAADLRRATLLPAGDARYYLNLGDDDAPRLLQNADGGAFVLDLRALEPTLKARRGDLYIDGAAAPAGFGEMPDRFPRLAMNYGPDDRQSNNIVDMREGAPERVQQSWDMLEGIAGELGIDTGGNIQDVLEKLWKARPTDAVGEAIEDVARVRGVKPPWAKR